MASNTYANTARAQAGHVVAKSLMTAQPVVILDKFMKSIPMPQHEGDKIFFRRANLLAPVQGAPLAEGVTPAHKALSYTRIEASPQYYGDVIEFNDVVTDLVDDPILTDMADIMGTQIAETKEGINFDVLKAGTNKFYDDGASTLRTQVINKVTSGRLQSILRQLQRNKARPITKILKSTQNYGTQSIDASYICFGHTDLLTDLEAMAGFKKVADYGGSDTVNPHEVGSWGRFRFVLSPEYAPYADGGALAATNGMVSTTGTQCDVYPIVILGMDSCATIPLAGRSAIKPTIIRPDVLEKSDPLGRQGICAWKIACSAIRTNELWMAVLEVAATADA
ncbi:MAG: N4-gp56 family major capsid protein [Cycloclasticus sp.]